MDNSQVDQAYRDQADRGQRATLALEYVGEMIDEEIKVIYAALASPERRDYEKLVTYLRAFVWVKNKLLHQKAVGEESAKILREEQ